MGFDVDILAFQTGFFDVRILGFQNCFDVGLLGSSKIWLLFFKLSGNTEIYSQLKMDPQ